MSTWLIGGGGFIGSELARHLVESGRDVAVLGRSPAPTNPLPPQVRYVVGDYGEEAILAQVADSADEVVHLAYATVPQASYTDPYSDITANLPPTVRLFRAVAGRHARKVVFISSGGTVYGPTDASLIDEDEPTHPISPYGITKLALEKYARMLFTTAELPVVVVRPANAYGERQTARGGQGFVAAAIESILDRQPVALFGEHGTIRDYIHVSDVASGIIAALDSGEAGSAYNIGTGQGRSNSDVLAALEPLAREAGLAISTTVTPRRPFDVPRNVLDSSRLRAVSDWTPQVSFKDGIERSWSAFVDRRRGAQSG
ncbi:MAG: NAD-dependent epimerase/dehydratase family protein [Candidatus Limnocylindrales bacterium]